MTYVMNHPRILCLLSVLVMWLAALAGVRLRERLHVPEKDDKDNLSLVVSATLTLLGLMIGFTFSLASSRYDQRRLYEEDEANAIGTEYVRTDLMPASEAAATRQLLVQYLDRRIAFYNAGYGDGVRRADRQTAVLQDRLWKSVQPVAAAQPTPVTALVVSGMNDVLNSQGYAQFAWWNRIPISAWILMGSIALFANVLVGYATKRTRAGTLLLIVLPLIVSVSFFLVADIDSPRGGIIRVHPIDLISLAQSLGAPTA